VTPHDQVLDDAVRFVDVMEGAIAQTAHGGIVFVVVDVAVRLIDQLQGAMITASASPALFDRRMVIQTLAIVNRSTLDLCNGFVDLVDGALLFFVNPVGRREPVQVSAGVAQIGERVQVCRMPSRFVGEA
jgi:hypothetical protein